MTPSPTARTAYWTPKVVNASDVHDHDWRGGLLMILAAILALGWIDANQRAVDAAESLAAVEESLRQERAARALPGTVYIIEAATPAEAQTKFARIAGGADAERYRLWSVTK